ncbi:MAG: hypothetical protein ABIN18_16115 [Pseudomonadota bacterium]
MLKKLPDKLEEELFEHCKESYKSGIAVRRNNVIYSAIILTLLLIVLAFIDGISNGFVVAIIVAASSLCIIWAVMSMSASLNMQCDTLTRLIVHYTETERS